MNTTHALRLGLTRLQKRGWRAGQYGKRDRGPVCMISALDLDQIGPCRPYLRTAIQEAYGRQWNVNTWQDSAGRRFEEVEQMYSEAMLLSMKDDELAAAS